MKNYKNTLDTSSSIIKKTFYMSMIALVLATAPSCKDKRSVTEISAENLEDTEENLRDANNKVVEELNEYNQAENEKTIAYTQLISARQVYATNPDSKSAKNLEDAEEEYRKSCNTLDEELKDYNEALQEQANAGVEVQVARAAYNQLPK